MFAGLALQACELLIQGEMGSLDEIVDEGRSNTCRRRDNVGAGAHRQCVNISDVGVGCERAVRPDSGLLNVGLTRRVWDHDINGYGSNSCGRDGEVAIERYEWFGWWPIKRETLGAHGFNVAVSTDCRGTGTWKYRTSVTVYPRQKFSKRDH